MLKLRSKDGKVREEVAVSTWKVDHVRDFLTKKLKPQPVREADAVASATTSSKKAKAAAKKKQ